MISRCTCKNNEAYQNYGGRGIKVCKRWRIFENFYLDMGDKPAGKTLDRINNNDDYSPENCRWASPKEQSRNKRNNVWITFGEKTQILTDWANEVGLSPGTLKYRIDAGWPVEKALTKGAKRPPMKSGQTSKTQNN